jgi:zinc protease
MRTLVAGEETDGPTYLWFASLLLLFATGGCLLSGEPNDTPSHSERFRLDNGLTVLIRPIKGAGNIALVVLYNIGGDYDPPGRSGLAHLVEHVYVTAAAGTGPARTVEEYVKKYPAGWNAQTGDRYTVLATRVPKANMEKELQDAAARMNDLRVTHADLAREKPRILDELANMFGRIPNIAATNQARELLRPTPRDGRRAGVPDQIKATTLQEVQQHWQRYYKPRNAILVVAGDVDVQTTRQAVEAHFAKLPIGEELPAPGEPGEPKFGVVRELAVESVVPGAGPEACLAYAAPKPKSELYAAYLVMATRLIANGGNLRAGVGRQPVSIPLLDDPAVIYVAAPAKPGESAKDTTVRLETFVEQALAAKLQKDEPARVQQLFGLFLGGVELPDAQLAMNPYAVAFALGRREQLGIDPAKLKKALEACTEEEFRRAARELFASDRHTAAFINVKAK